MKKVISLILATIMLLALFIPALAEEEPYETITLNGTNYFKGESENFILEYDNNAYHPEIQTSFKDRKCVLKIQAKENSGLQINRLEANINPRNLDIIETNCEATYKELNGITYIDGIHNTEFLLVNRWVLELASKVKIYYEPAQSLNASTISEGNIWIVWAVGACVVVVIAAVVIVKKEKQKTEN